MILDNDTGLPANTILAVVGTPTTVGSPGNPGSEYRPRPRSEENPPLRRKILYVGWIRSKRRTYKWTAINLRSGMMTGKTTLFAKTPNTFKWMERKNPVQPATKQPIRLERRRATPSSEFQAGNIVFR
jgi:hypothetical protein